MKEKGQTNYNEVANELVQEYIESLPDAVLNEETMQYDAKNIRRRVYGKQWSTNYKQYKLLYCDKKILNQNGCRYIIIL